MDREKAYLVATPFKKHGKKSLKVNDFIFSLSLDFKWGSPEKVRALLREAEAEGLVKLENDMIHASIEMDMMEIPIGFKPSTNEGIMDRGIALISAKTGMSRREVIALANERQDALLKLVDLDVIVLLLAGEMMIDVSELAREAYENLIVAKKTK